MVRSHDPTLARDRTRALAAFYGAGGLLIALGLVLPTWSGQEGAQLIAVSALAISTGLALVIAGRRVPLWLCQVLVVVGSILIMLCMLAGAGGAATATWSFFYVFVAIYAACFFSRWMTTAQIAVATTLESIAIIHVGDGQQAAAQVVVSAGTVVAAAVVVGTLMHRVRDLAAHDSLTGLPNRRNLDLVLDGALAQADRLGSAVGVLALDLNGFKAVNDTFGHTEGDRLLVEAAKAWTSQLRRGDLLARTGGDEFVVVLPLATEETAEAVSRRLQAVTPVPLSTSAGTALSQKGESAADLLARADQALYAVKPRYPRLPVPRPEQRKGSTRV